MTGDIYGVARIMRNEEGKVIRRLRTHHIDVKDITVLERADKRKN